MCVWWPLRRADRRAAWRLRGPSRRPATRQPLTWRATIIPGIRRRVFFSARGLVIAAWPDNGKLSHPPVANVGVHVLNETTGAALWSTPPSWHLVSFTGDMLLLASGSDLVVRSLQSGGVRWAQTLVRTTGLSRCKPAVRLGRTVVVTMTCSGLVQAFDLSGSFAWNASVPAPYQGSECPEPCGGEPTLVVWIGDQDTILMQWRPGMRYIDPPLYEEWVRNNSGAVERCTAFELSGDVRWTRLFQGYFDTIYTYPGGLYYDRFIPIVWGGDVVLFRSVSTLVAVSPATGLTSWQSTGGVRDCYFDQRGSGIVIVQVVTTEIQLLAINSTSGAQLWAKTIYWRDITWTPGPDDTIIIGAFGSLRSMSIWPGADTWVPVTDETRFNSDTFREQVVTIQLEAPAPIIALMEACRLHVRDAATGDPLVSSSVGLCQDSPTRLACGSNSVAVSTRGDIFFWDRRARLVAVRLTPPKDSEPEWLTREAILGMSGVLGLLVLTCAVCGVSKWHQMYQIRKRQRNIYWADIARLQNRSRGPVVGARESARDR